MSEPPVGPATGPTVRTRQKAARRQQLLAAAARLFAERGFHAVSIEELGGAVGVSGPAVYRHFASKEAILSDLLVSVSQRLLDGGRAKAAGASTPQEAIKALVAFHLDFALHDCDLIRVQDRDFANLPASDAKTVRRLQRAYVEIWVDVLVQLDPACAAVVARTKAHATFGLLNSTPHSATSRDLEITRSVLAAMAMAALGARPSEPLG